MSLPETMKAVIFDGPFEVSVQDRPVPKSPYNRYHGLVVCTFDLTLFQVSDDRDIIVKVQATALCGS